MRSFLRSGLVVVMLVGCSGGDETPEGEVDSSVEDADATMPSDDSTADSAVDSIAEDSTVDSAVDSTIDSSIDSIVDSAIDSAVADTKTDTPIDTGKADTGVDTGFDAGPCTPATCMTGYWCDSTTGTCKLGCDADDDCFGGFTCTVATHTCACSGPGTHVCFTSYCYVAGPTSCGSSCTVCPTAPFQKPTCDTGTCGLSCVTTCGGTTCIDLGGDTKNCGTCGNVCGAGQACSSGKCVTPCPGGSGFVDIQPTTDMGASDDASSVRTADFNGDNKLDAIWLGSNGILKIGYGNGDGTLVDYAGGWTTTIGGRSVQVADLNGDTKLDLVVVSDTLLWVLTGKGDGTFNTAVKYTLSSGAVEIAVGDLNGDKKPDVVVAHNSAPSGFISVLLNTGTGTATGTNMFTFPTVRSITGTSMQQLAMGDFNGDNKLDVAIPTTTASGPVVDVLLGDGAGAFTDGTNVPIVDPGGRLVAADLQNDGKIDLVVAQPNLGTPASGGSLRLLIGQGNGTFTVKGPFTATGLGNANIAVADVTGDGLLDVLETNNPGTGQQTLRTHVLTASNTLLDPTSVEYFLGPIATGDFNGDLEVDAVTSGPQLHVTLNTGTALGQPATVSNATDPTMFGDATGDGVLDLLSTGASSTSCHKGNGDGTYQAGVTLSGFVASARGDVDGDGKLDIIEVGTTQVRVAFGDGACGFGSTATFTISGQGVAAAVGDFNGDGKKDIAVTSRASGGTGFKAISVLFGNGGRTFLPEKRLDLSFEPGTIKVADANLDGRDDMFVADMAVGEGGIGIAYAATDGTLTFGGVAGSTGGCTSCPDQSTHWFDVGDLDSDGHVDIVYTKAATGILYRGLGQGNGRFGYDVSILMPTGPVRLGDFNADGRLDILVINGNRLYELLRKSDGSYARASFDALDSTPFIDVGDVNGDGKTDVVVNGKLLRAVCR